MGGKVLTLYTRSRPLPVVLEILFTYMISRFCQFPWPEILMVIRRAWWFSGGKQEVLIKPYRERKAIRGCTQRLTVNESPVRGYTQSPPIDGEPASGAHKA